MHRLSNQFWSILPDKCVAKLNSLPVSSLMRFSTGRNCDEHHGWISRKKVTGLLPEFIEMNPLRQLSLLSCFQKRTLQTKYSIGGKPYRKHISKKVFFVLRGVVSKWSNIERRFLRPVPLLLGVWSTLPYWKVQVINSHAWNLINRGLSHMKRRLDKRMLLPNSGCGEFFDRSNDI